MKIIENPFVKRNNKQLKMEQFDAYKKVRKTWGISPVTKVLKSKKKYNRKKMKKYIKKIMKEEDL